MITAVVVSGKERQLLIVEIARTTYFPDLEVSALVITGFCSVELKLAGPDHEYVAFVMVVANKFNVLPAQSAPLFVAVGFAGRGFIVTAVVSGNDVQWSLLDFKM